MNPLLAQFIEEAGDLLASVDTGLLALERDPENHDVLDEIFRTAHTLKGSSGLFDVLPLTQLTHAAEDVLDAVRSGQLQVGSELVDAVMAAFDLVGVWIGELAASECLPSDAAQVALPCVAALRTLMGEGDRGAAMQPAIGVRTLAPVAVPTWASALAAAHPGVVSAGDIAVRYTPAPDCFFRGEDPLHLLRQLPELHQLSMTREGLWPAIGELDEYDCRLVFTAVAGCSQAEVVELFRYVPDEVEIVALPGVATARWNGIDVALPLLEIAHGLILSQHRALLSIDDAGFTAAEQDEHNTRGRLDAIVTVLSGALSAAGLEIDEVQNAAAGCWQDGSRQRLLTLTDQLLAGAAAAIAESVGTAGDSGSVEVEAASSGVAAQEGGQGASSAAGRTLKVDQAKVDHLMELVGELIVAKNALPFLARAAEDEHGVPLLARALKDQYGVLNRLTEELQASVMEVRMVPLSVAFGRFPRLVRDVSRKLGKSVRLITEGEETCADKDVIELIADPLVHLVRNSLDHGLEPPALRSEAGKSDQALLTLSASQDGDAIVIEVRDDGRGIDPQRLREKVVERGLMDFERAAALSDSEAVNLIFLAGLSTANEVSDLSGRGVGMDAVRHAVERLGGSVTVHSSLGEGTTVRLRVPLSMAVSRVMIVGVGGQRFGVPVDIVEETVRVPVRSLQRIKGSSAIVLRDRLVPLISMHNLLQSKAPEESADLAVLVVRVDGEPLGLTVDRFHDNLDVIVKPLKGVLAASQGFAGTAMLGDGDVLLVVNVKEMLATSREIEDAA